MRFPNRKRAGLTLVDALVVVAVLGLLAAVAVPQFTRRTEEGRMAKLVSSLGILRTSIDSYWWHHGHFPGRDGAEQLAAQLTSRTDSHGDAYTAGMGRSYGPYIRHGELPQNPFNESQAVRVLDRMSSGPAGEAGWVYDRSTGEIRPNNPGRSPDGTRYFDL